MARAFAQTWWGKAWIEALEHRARLDPNRLPRGRTYARQDKVVAMSVGMGIVRAHVQGTRPTPYVVTLNIRKFTDPEWERVLDAIASKAGHTAALLDGELEPGIVDDARSVGVELFPTAGELTLRCSCPDWAIACKHAAAVCYLVADRLDVDPFELLELRGMPRTHVMAALRSRRSAGAPVESEFTGSRPETMTAREAWDRRLRSLPTVPSPPRRVARPAPWPSDPPPGSSLDADGLRLLAADAVRRAHAMAVGEAESGLSLGSDADLARRAAFEPDRAELSARTGVPARRLAALGSAWAFGGAEGVAVIGQAPWTPDPRVMAEARQRLAESGVTGMRVSQNSIAFGDRQVRLGHDGRWWPFVKRSGRWELAGTSSSDPEDLVGTA